MLSVLNTIRRTYRRLGGQTLASEIKSPVVVDGLRPGTSWNHLKIVSVLGRGSFGIVFRATDTHLNRSVALKFLEGQDAIREGRILASLNEDSIVKVHSFEEYEGITALCLELVQGVNLETFAEKHGKLTAEHASLLGIQICRALAALHRKGLLHRDLKPANVILNENGRIVLIDLGLGTAWSEEQAEVAGTLPFMAPEVLEGQPASPASDLYSVGALLFCLVSGCHPVTGQSLEEFRDHHRRHERFHLADMGTFPGTFIDSVETALSPKPSRRFRSAGEFAAALEGVFIANREQRTKFSLKWMLVSLGFVALLSGVVFLHALYQDWSRHSAPLEVRELVRGPGFAHSASTSGDGRMLVYTWDGGDQSHMDIWAKYPEQQGASQLTHSTSDSVQPDVSPDGTLVAYRSEVDGGGVYVTSTLGGGVRKLANDGRDPRFSSDGKSVAYWTGLDGNNRFATGRIYVIPVEGGLPIQMARDFVDARRPIWSSDNKWILFLGTKDAARFPEETSDLYLVSIDQPNKILKTGFMDRLRLANLKLYECPLAWANDALYFAAYHGESSNLWSTPIHIGWHGITIGPPRQITSGPAIEAEPFALANGTIVFSTLISNVNIWVSSLNASRTATPTKLTSPSFTVTSQPSVSKNGRYLAFIRREATTRSVYLRDLNTNQEIRVSSTSSRRPVVSPDGNLVAFSDANNSKESIWVYNRQTALTKKACEDCGIVLDWSPDMHFLSYSRGARPQIYLLNLDTGLSTPLLKSSGEILYDEFRFSPDGRYVAFVRQSGNSQRDIMVSSFQSKKLSDENTWTRIDTGSRWNNNPRWNQDGHDLIFLSRRDSFACIWRVHFDSAPGKTSVPESVQHLHSGNHSVEELSDISFQLAVGGNEVFYTLPELSSTIWAAEPKN